ncbi:hypothetical protein AB1Y20_009972 [Prymnesium parvum]|uniref:Hexosyltransferase n=1 Tax=Prymnesium parvum TaxID=97485 RepID=A0AB34K3J7_PRYPA
MRWLLPAPPLQELKLGLLAFVCQRPSSAAIAAAVRVSSTEGNDVLVLAPPREQETVERLGGMWRNMSSAELAVRAWTRRYRHMSYNTKSYELFCFQRWLMLEYTLQPMKLPPEAAIAVLDDDILLFRPPARWLRELSSLAFHNESQTTSVLGIQAFRIHSKGSLQRFAAFLQWLYGLRLAHLASIIKRFGHRSPLARLSVSQRRGLSPPLLSTLTNSSSDVTPSFHHFSDIEAIHALCTLSKEGLIPEQQVALRTNMLQASQLHRDGSPAFIGSMAAH